MTRLKEKKLDGLLVVRL